MSTRPKSNYEATLSKGRQSWCVIFRHPLRSDADGKLGLRVRRGLSTSNEDEARQLVEQLNTILRDESFHSPSGRSTAERRFGDSPAVRAFFDNLMPDITDPWLVREKVIKIPPREDGYTRVRFIGATGSGKTTCLRQMIGTHPTRERFPSTSTAKTTTSEVEVILRAGGFEAIVTFTPKEHVRLYVEECVTRATIAALEGEDASHVAACLLEHTEQRFRLSYLLGTPESVTASEDDLADEDASDDAEDKETDEAPLVTPAEREQFTQFLASILAEVRTLAGAEENILEKEVGFNLQSLENKDRDAFLDLLEQELPKRQDFHAIVDRIMDAVDERFELFSAGEFVRETGDWPSYWTFTAAETERAEFLRTINRFSSNYAPHFGKLLTPLVNGMRVAGPFQTSFSERRQPRLVLMDGEGLGHAAEVSTSVSTAITKRYATADTIVLIDNAAQPMMSAPCAVLRSIASSGHDQKLAICFTHFDHVKGANIPGVTARKQHVMGSLYNALAAVANAVDSDIDKSLKRHLKERVFFLSSIDKVLKAGETPTKSELCRMVEMFEGDIKPPRPITVQPFYDDANLVICLQNAVTQFRDPWKSRLGFPSRSSLPTVHWTRIKALSRRFAHFATTEYDNLRPVADLLECMNERMTTFLSKPVQWEPSTSPEDMQREAVAAIQRVLAEKLFSFVEGRVRDSHLKDWIHAFNDGGTGSARRRAYAIEAIFDQSAPLLGETPDELSYELIQFVRRLVREAIEAGGGKMLNSELESTRTP